MRILSASGQPRFAIRKRDSRSKEALLSWVRRRHSSTASPTGLVALGGLVDTEARPICARYQAICSGVSSPAEAIPGMKRAAARARREMEDRSDMPGMIVANSLQRAE